MKKIIVGGVADGSQRVNLADLTTKLFASLVNLARHCCVTSYDDGSPRKPGWFTIKTMGSAWMVQVKEPDAAAQLQVTANTLDEALIMADLLLGTEGAPWAPDDFLRMPPKRK